MHTQILWDPGTEHIFKSTEFVGVVSVKCRKYLWQKH